VNEKDKQGWELELSLKTRSSDVTLFTDGKKKVTPLQHQQLDASDIPVITLAIERLEGDNGQLKKIVFKNGEERKCDALFFVNGYTQQCSLAETFDCELCTKGVVVTNRLQQTKTPGLYVAGDADKDMHFVVVAAAEGAKAGVTMNKELQKEMMEQHLKAAEEK
jgi:thioredoxin reductase